MVVYKFWNYRLYRVFRNPPRPWCSYFSYPVTHTRQCRYITTPLSSTNDQQRIQWGHGIYATCTKTYAYITCHKALTKQYNVSILCHELVRILTSVRYCYTQCAFVPHLNDKIKWNKMWNLFLKLQGRKVRFHSCKIRGEEICVSHLRWWARPSERPGARR